MILTEHLLRRAMCKVLSCLCSAVTHKPLTLSVFVGSLLLFYPTGLWRAVTVPVATFQVSGILLFNYPNRDLICTCTFAGTSTSTIIWTDGRESSFLNTNTTNRDSHRSHRIAHLDKGYSWFSQAPLRIFLPAGMSNRNRPSL